MLEPVIIYGPPQSSYVRAARMTCAEKGIEHTLEAVDFRSDEYRKQRHPYGKVPSLEHGEVKLFEAQAIVRYIDEAFAGPALQPAGPAGRAQVEQWISVLNAYIYPRIIAGYALHYIVPRGPQGQPDRVAIDAAMPNLEHDLALLNHAYDGRTWLTGDMISLADLFVAPVLHTVSLLPEGQAEFAKNGNLQRVLKGYKGRVSEPFLAAPPF